MSLVDIVPSADSQRSSRNSVQAHLESRYCIPSTRLNSILTSVSRGPPADSARGLFRARVDGRRGRVRGASNGTGGPCTARADGARPGWPRLLAGFRPAAFRPPKLQAGPIPHTLRCLPPRPDPPAPRSARRRWCARELSRAVAGVGLTEPSKGRWASEESRWR